MKHDPDRSLRLALRTNAAFSILCALVLVSLAGPLAAAMSVPSPWVLRGVGLSLVPFALGLLRNAARPRVRRGEAALASALDAGWVVGSLWLVLGGPVELSALGDALVLAVAGVVGACALWQALGLRRAFPVAAQVTDAT